MIAPTPTLAIRPTVPADAARIVAPIHQMGPDSRVTDNYVLDYLSGTEREILVARLDEEVFGLLSYSVRADLYHTGNSILIEELVLDESHRGQGIGGALMEALLKRAAQLSCKELCLAVMPGNEQAIRFYRRHGLVEERRHCSWNGTSRMIFE